MYSLCLEHCSLISTIRQATHLYFIAVTGKSGYLQAPTIYITNIRRNTDGSCFVVYRLLYVSIFQSVVDSRSSNPMIPTFPIIKAILAAQPNTIALTKVLTWHHCLSSGDGCHGNKLNIYFVVDKHYHSKKVLHSIVYSLSYIGSCSSTTTQHQYMV